MLADFTITVNLPEPLKLQYLGKTLETRNHKEYLEVCKELADEIPNLLNDNDGMSYGVTAVSCEFSGTLYEEVDEEEDDNAYNLSD